MEAKEKNRATKEGFETTINRTSTANYESLQARDSKLDQNLLQFHQNLLHTISCLSRFIHL